MNGEEKIREEREGKCRFLFLVIEDEGEEKACVASCVCLFSYSWRRGDWGRKGKVKAVSSSL